MNKQSLKKHLKYMVPEVKLALIKETGKKKISITCPEDIEQFIEPMRFYPDENFVSFFLDAKNNVTGFSITSRGTVSQSLVHSREVFNTT